MPNTAPLTGEQRTALELFASLNGRYWKAALRDLWEHSNRRDWQDAETIVYALRNTHGPSWLIRFRF